MTGVEIRGLIGAAIFLAGSPWMFRAARQNWSSPDLVDRVVKGPNVWPFGERSLRKLLRVAHLLALLLSVAAPVLVTATVFEEHLGMVGSLLRVLALSLMGACLCLMASTAMADWPRQLLPPWARKG